MPNDLLYSVISPPAKVAQSEIHPTSLQRLTDGSCFGTMIATQFWKRFQKAFLNPLPASIRQCVFGLTQQVPQHPCVTQTQLTAIVLHKHFARHRLTPAVRKVL